MGSTRTVIRSQSSIIVFDNRNDVVLLALQRPVDELGKFLVALENAKGYLDRIDFLVHHRVRRDRADDGYFAVGRLDDDVVMPGEIVNNDIPEQSELLEEWEIVEFTETEMII